jgi:hypothetical protein
MPLIATPVAPQLGIRRRCVAWRSGDSVAARRAAYLGSVGVGFGVPALVRGVLGQFEVPGLELALYAGGPGQGVRRIGPADRLLHGAGAGPGPAFETVLPVDFNGNLWKARFSMPKADLYNGF